jgi:hypothetical protein
MPATDRVQTMHTPVEARCFDRPTQLERRMKHKISSRKRAIYAGASSAVLAIGLAACGGGSGDDNEPEQPAATQLRGVVATGAAVAGATVTVHDADSATANVTATAAADGSYVVDVSALRAPLLVIAQGTLDGAPVFLGSVVPTVAANSDNTANVTPLTSAVAILASNDGELTNPTVLAGVTASQVANASALVVNTLRSDPAIAAALGSSFDPLTTPFTPDGTGIDAVLNQLEVTAEAGVVSIANLSAPIGAAGAPPPAVLTPALVATPNAAPPLPASTTDPLPSAARLRELAAKLQACLALPVAQRVTKDAAGTVSAVSATCDFAPAMWRSDGRNWVQRMGQDFFKFDSLTGAKAGEPVIDAVFPPLNYSGTTYQPPVCNASTCLVVRMPMTSASGKQVLMDFVLGVVNGVWDYVGNQRPYNLFVDHRIQRKTQINTAFAAANPTNYFAQSRIEASLRLIFDPSVGNTAQVRAVRWTGPGLPAAGVVTHRSGRCGTDDRFAISNQEGILTGNNASFTQWWNNNGGADFIVSAAGLDGSAMELPAVSGNWATNPAPSNQDVAPAPVTAAIPARSLYTAEIFYFSNNSNVPDEVVKVRSGAAYEHASGGAAKAWPTLAPATIDAYLKPSGAGAGAISTLANTLSWTNPAGGYIGGAYLFGQNRVSATNAENETANYWKRGRLDFEIKVLGDSSASGLEFADPRSGASMSIPSSTTGTNPNPRCTNPDVEPLDGDSTRLSYREIGINFRGPDRKFYNDISFWSN